MIKYVVSIIVIIVLLLGGFYYILGIPTSSKFFAAFELPMITPSPTTMVTDVKVRGTLECLPKSSDGPQTMECAFGLKDENGRYYGLNDPEWKFLIGAAMNTKVTVTGKLKDKNAGDKYNIIGTIEITNLEK